MNNTIIKHLNRIPMERHMSDWQIGDLAVCVEDGVFIDEVGDPCGQGAVGQLAKGRVYCVGGVGFLVGHVILDVGLPFPKLATRFRKIRPDEHEACEPEFVTLLKRAKRPVMNPVDLAIAQLLGKPSSNVEWLRRAGPIAKRLNREAQLENERRTVSGVEDQ